MKKKTMKTQLKVEWWKLIDHDETSHLSEMVMRHTKRDLLRRDRQDYKCLQEIPVVNDLQYRPIRVEGENIVFGVEYNSNHPDFREEVE